MEDALAWFALAVEAGPWVGLLAYVVAWCRRFDARSARYEAETARHAQQAWIARLAVESSTRRTLPD